MKHSFIKKLISLTTAYSLLYSVTVQGNAVSAENHNKKISIAHSLGEITSRWNSELSSEKFVIHIKDIHCEYDIQKNISGILEMLVKQNKVELVTLEGASGQVDTSLFRVFPDKQAKEKVCDIFLKKGILTGAENLSITKGDTLNFEIFGVEDPQLYIDNLSFFRNTVFSSQKVDVQLNKLEDFIDSVKKSVYPAELYLFDKKSSNYLNNEIEFDDWIRLMHIKAVEYNIPAGNYPNLKALSEIFKLEKENLDYNAIAVEKQILTAELKNRLSDEEFAIYAKNEIKFNIGKIPPSQYFESLAKYADTKKYPRLCRYIQLSKLRKNVDRNAIFAESKELEKEIKKRLCKRLESESLSDKLQETCAILDEISNAIHIFRKICTIKLSDKETEYFTANKDTLTPAKVIGSLKKLCETENISIVPEIFSAKFAESIAQSIDSGMKFYDLADKRSKTMADNLISKMNADRKNCAVIITGGFHSSYIENYLKDNNISFITVTPKSSASDNAKYMSLMTDTALDLTSKFTNGIHIAFPVLFSTMVSNSAYFESLRQEMAKSLLEFTNMSVSQYRAQLRDDFSRTMFNKLMVLAGMDLSEIEQTTIGELISDLRPESIADFILTYDNEKITAEIASTGVKASELTFEDKKVFADYLLSLLDIAIEVTADLKKRDYYLTKILTGSNTARYSILHTSAYAKYKNNYSPSNLQYEDNQADKDIRNLAFSLITEIAATGMISLPDGFSEQDIKIGRKSLYGYHSGEIEDRIWFELIVTDKSGIEKRFFVKSARYGDFEVLGHKALQAIEKLDYRYHYSTAIMGDYAGFHITDYIGDMTAREFDPADTNAYSFARKLGEAVGIAFILGFVDRNLDNFRVILKDGQPESVVNIDLTGALAESKLPFNVLFEPITGFVKNARKQGLDNKTVNDIMLSFLMGFQDSIFDIQDYFTANKERLANHPDLAGSLRWQKALDRMNPDITEPVALIHDSVNYLNRTLNLDISAHVVDYTPEGVTESQRVQDFVEKQNFTRFDMPESFNSKVYVNKKGNIFLKQEGGAMHRAKNKIGLWLKNPISFVRSIGNYIFTLLGASALIIAAHRLGGVVPAMYNIDTGTNINIRQDGTVEQISNGFMQEKVEKTIKELFEQYCAQGNIEAINRLIDNYFQSQVTMWRRGVFDRDLNFFNNYGVDNLNTLEVKCFDIGNLTNNPLAGVIITMAKPNMDHIISQLANMVPPECVTHFKQQFAKIFSINNLMYVWNTDAPVMADRLMLNQRLRFVVAGQQDTDAQFAQNLTESDKVRRFIEAHGFKPFAKQEVATDMELLISSDSNYVLKTSGSMGHTVKSYFKALSYIADRLTKPIRKSNLLKFASLSLAAGIAMAYPQIFFYITFVVIFSATTLTVVIGLTKSPLGAIFLGPLLPILTPHKLKVGYARLGGLIPPMYKFKLRDGANISFAGKTIAVKEGLIQKKAKYTLRDVLKKLGQEGNVSEINRVIDKFFETQTQLWERGVFDIDFLSFDRNYGLNDLDALDIHLFDLGGISPYFLRGFMGITYEGKIGRKFMFDELKELIPEECVKHFTQKFKQTFTVMNLLRHWRKQKPVPLEKIDLNQLPDTVYDMPKMPVINGLTALQSAAIIDHISNFLNDTGLENEFRLGEELLKLFESCLRDNINPELTELMKKQINPQLLVRIMASKNSHIYKPLMGMSLNMMRTARRFDVGGVFFAAAESIVLDYIENMNNRVLKTEDKLKNSYSLIEESI